MNQDETSYTINYMQLNVQAQVILVAHLQLISLFVNVLIFQGN